MFTENPGIHLEQYIVMQLLFILELILTQDKDWLIWLIFGVLTPLSAIFQLYHGDQF